MSGTLPLRIDLRIVITCKANTVSGRYESDYEMRTKLEDWGSCLNVDSAVWTLNCKGSEKATVKFLLYFNTLRTGSFKLFKRPLLGFITILTL